jgi:type II secretory pathway component PulF
MKTATLDMPTSHAAGANRAANRSDSRALEMPEVDHVARTGVARKGRVRKQDIADMTAQLAIMTKSGVDLASALSSLVTQCERPYLAEVLSDINELVLSGNTLSESLKQHPDVFDGAYVATIAAAEASGRMAEVLQQLAEMQRSEMRLRRSIKSLATYPILLTVISTAVIATLVMVVLPKFSAIFDQYNTPLPAITKFLLAVAGEARSRWWLWIPLIAGGGVGAYAWRCTEQGRRAVDAALLHGVIIRNVVRPLLIGRTCRMISLLLQSGVPLLDSLRLCKQAINNTVYKELLDDLATSVVNGRGMAGPLSEAQIVPVSAREMLMTAERTGSLAEVSQLLGGYYEEEAETKMRSVVKLLEPMITVVMGAVVAVVVLAVMLPIFDLSSFSQEAH